MSRTGDDQSELLTLLSAACDDAADQEALGQLEELAGRDADCLGVILDYLQLHFDLRLELATRAAAEPVFQEIGGTAAGKSAERMVPPRLQSSWTPPPPLFLTRRFGAVGGALLCYSMAALMIATGVFAAWNWGLPAASSRVAGDRSSLPPTERAGPVALESAPNTPTPGPPASVWRGRVTKEVGCRWVDPATGPKNAAAGNIDLADGMFEMTLDSGVTVTTLGGPAAYRILSADSMCIKRGLVIVLTPPISGRVTTCFGPHGGPCLAAALPDSAGGGAARHGSSPRGAGSPFRILTPALGFADRGGMALCVNVENAVTTIAHSYDGRVDFQASRDRRARRPTLHLDSGSWVYTDRGPDGKQVVFIATEGKVPPSLARRLPKMTFPAYSQQTRPGASAQKVGPGA